MYPSKQQIARNNLQIRWSLWSNIVNNQTKTIHHEWFDNNNNNNNDNNYENYSDQISNTTIKYCTKFITKWNGLKVSSNDLPSTIKSYKEKSRSWLNGRRAMFCIIYIYYFIFKYVVNLKCIFKIFRQYGQWLYPVMITTMEKYANQISELVINDNVIIVNVDKNDKQKIKKLYKTIIINSCLIELCSAKMTINCRSKRVYLLCPNSIKSRKSETKKAMQRHATDDTHYTRFFPAHRNQAIHNFEKGRQDAITELTQLMLKYNIPNSKIKVEPLQKSQTLSLPKLNDNDYDYKKDEKMLNVYNNLPKDITNMFMNVINNGLAYQKKYNNKYLSNCKMDVGITQLIDDYNHNINVNYHANNENTKNNNYGKNDNYGNMINNQDILSIMQSIQSIKCNNDTNGFEYQQLLLFLIKELIN